MQLGHALNRSGFFSVIRVIVVGPLTTGGLIETPQRNDLRGIKTRS